MSRIVDAVVKLAVVVVFMLAGHGGYARTFEFKAIGTKGAGTKLWYGDDDSHRAIFKMKIGSASKIDDLSELEIRVATVLKDVITKKNLINDINSIRFPPINMSKPLYFMVRTGAAREREYATHYSDGRVNRGWQVAGAIIEIWQKEKVVRHWSNVSGTDGKIKLTKDVQQAKINSRGDWCDHSYCTFDNPTEIVAVDQKGEKVNLEEVLQKFADSQEGTNSVDIAKTYYLISDVRNVDCNRDYILRCIEHNRDIGSYVQKRKFTADELSDYKMEHPKCKEFTSMESVKKFVANGETAKSNAHWYFAVRNAKSVSQYDKRIALEEIVSGAYGEYNGGNVLKRKMTEEEVLDFKALNPDCKMFRDVEEFKAFIRAAEVRNANTVVVHDDIVPVSRIARRRERQSQTPIPTGETVELSAEEVQKRVDAEMEYDKEMFEKKFGKEARK